MIAEKQRLRNAMRGQRRLFAGHRPTRFDVMPPPDIRLSGIVASYRSIGSEIDAAPLDERVQSLGGTLLYPRVESVGVMRFLQPSSAADWEEGPYGIIQPRSHCPALTPNVALVPLIAFDRRGGRLGQGGGYYDRALAACPAAFKLGIAWSVQEVDNVPMETWDIGLDAVLTEREWIVT